MSNTCRSKFQTFVLLDLETTGLPFDQPKITELAMIAVSASALDALPPNERYPRIINKFVKFFNPTKSIHSKAIEVSQLTNELLQNQPTFSRQTIRSIEDFLNDFPRPICFVAHNGNAFDFPILFNEIQMAMPSDQSSELFTFACVDSLRFFREIYRILIEPTVSPPSPSIVNGSHRGYVEIPMKYSSIEQCPSLKLEKIYEREFNSTLNSHRAEDDCLMLLAVIKVYLADWFEWIDENSRALNEFNHLPSISLPNKILVSTEKKVKRPLKF